MRSPLTLCVLYSFYRLHAPCASADYLVKEFEIEAFTGLSPDAQEAQEQVCKLPPRYKKLAERSLKSIGTAKEEDLHYKFSWLVRRA